MSKFELDLLKEFQDDGCGEDCFDEIGTLTGMKMRGYYQGVQDDETIDELVWRYEETQVSIPLNYSQLRENMWVYDKMFKVCRQVHKFYDNGEHYIIQFKSGHYPELAEAYFFEENRFYPIMIPSKQEENNV